MISDEEKSSSNVLFQNSNYSFLYLEMSPFRWPLPKHDIMLAKEYAARKPDKIDEWDSIALVLSSEFGTEDKPIVLTGRACKERLRRLLDKYKDDDKKSLRK